MESALPLAAGDKPAAAPSSAPPITSFDDVVRLAGDRGEPRLRAELINGIHLLSFETGRIELRLHATAQKDLANRLSKRLQEWTGRPWAIVLSNSGGEATLAEQQASDRAKRLAEAKSDPAVQAVLAAFPGAEIREVRDLAPPAPIDLPEPEPDDS
jgi:DNA polymerase-3 subunit gamma/tau